MILSVTHRYGNSGSLFHQPLTIWIVLWDGILRFFHDLTITNYIFICYHNQYRQSNLHYKADSRFLYFCWEHWPDQTHRVYVWMHFYYDEEIHSACHRLTLMNKFELPSAFTSNSWSTSYSGKWWLTPAVSFEFLASWTRTLELAFRKKFPVPSMYASPPRCVHPHLVFMSSSEWYAWFCPSF
jgi:hypothetical protein